MTSDVDKRVFVKVAGDGDEQIFGEYIDLKARVPYNFSRQVTLAEDMEGVLDLYFGMGKCDGDAAATNSAANITLSNVSFKTTTQIPDPIIIITEKAQQIKQHYQVKKRQQLIME